MKKNLVLAIGDGMGLHQLSLARLHGHRHTCKEFTQKLHLDTWNLVALQATSSLNSIVTDSAAAGTALATGIRCNNKQVGIPEGEGRRPTLADKLAAKGYDVVIVTTSRITHATPAAFYARVQHRDDERCIASQFKESGVRGIIGGGQFVRDRGTTSTPILDDLSGVEFIDSYDALWKSLPTGKFAGAFAPSHLPYEIDREPGDKSLKELSEYVFDQLSATNKPFCMIIESARIDHACHSHDAATVAKETLHLDALLHSIGSRCDKDETLVVATADHSCGGPALSEKLTHHIDLLREQEHSHRYYADKHTVGDRLNVEAAMKELAKHMDPDLRERAAASMLAAEGKYEIRTAIGHWISRSMGVEHYDISFLNHINSTFGLTFGHDGTDVPVFANQPLAWPDRLWNSEIEALLIQSLE